MSATHCFNARIGADRYRLELLPLYPKLEHLRQIIKRLAVVYRRERKIIDFLRTLESDVENRWDLVLEMTGILANSFAPLPSSNCDNERAREYCQLWSMVNTLFSNEIVPQFNEALDKMLTTLQNIRDDPENLNVSWEAEKPQHSQNLKDLYRETRYHESEQVLLRKTQISSLELDGEDGVLSLEFPFVTSRII